MTGPHRRRRWRAAARLLAPSAAALVLRGSQLMALLCLTRLSVESSRDAVVSSFGIISAIAIVSDSGAASYLLSRPRQELNAISVRQTLVAHASLGLMGNVAAVVLILARFGPHLSVTLLLVLVSVAVAQLLDSATRVVRTPLLVFGRDDKYAMFDAALGGAKTAVFGTALVTDTLWPLFLVPVLSVLVFGWAAALAVATVAPGRDSRVRLRSVYVFGLNGAVSALYSQSPLIISGFLLSPAVTATLTVAYRITQPLELIPATMTQQAIPRLAAGRLDARRLWTSFAVLGLVACVGVYGVRGVIADVFIVRWTPTLVLPLILIAVPVKFGNYALTAVMFARDLASSKLRRTVVVGAVACTLAAGAAVSGSVTAVAGVTVLSEALLAFLLIRVVRRAGERVTA